MRLLKLPALVLPLALFLVAPAHAQFQGCPDPSPETLYLLEQCGKVDLCVTAVSWIKGCTTLAKAIEGYFKKPALDEYETEETVTPGSDPEHMRKVNALHKKLADDAASKAYVEIMALDRYYQDRMASECGDVLKFSCRYSVENALKLPEKVGAFNGDKSHVASRGRINVTSPAIAERYEKLFQDKCKAQEGRDQKPAAPEQEDPNSQEAKSKRTAETIKKNLAIVEDQKKKKELAAAQAERNKPAAPPLLTDSEREAIRVAAQAEEARKAQLQREANAERREILKAVGQIVDAIGELNKGKARPAPSSSGGGGCSGIGSTTCR